jgi:hypothetical protein
MISAVDPEPMSRTNTTLYLDGPPEVDPPIDGNEV